MRKKYAKIESHILYYRVITLSSLDKEKYTKNRITYTILSRDNIICSTKKIQNFITIEI